MTTKKLFTTPELVEALRVLSQFVLEGSDYHRALEAVSSRFGVFAEDLEPLYFEKYGHKTNSRSTKKRAQDLILKWRDKYDIWEPVNLPWQLEKLLILLDSMYLDLIFEGVGCSDDKEFYSIMES